MAGCGLEFPFLRVRPDAVARARVDSTAAERFGAHGIDVFAWDDANRDGARTGLLPGLSVPEDPATGSAALGLGVWLVASGLLPGDGESAYTVHQGLEMHRPSVLACTVTARDGGGRRRDGDRHVVPIGRGEIGDPAVRRLAGALDLVQAEGLAGRVGRRRVARRGGAGVVRQRRRR